LIENPVEEFKSISSTPALEVDDQSTLYRNKNKNRYGDVLPLKTTVVKLSRVGDDISSEYINANFVQDIERDAMPNPQKYICTQAPLPNTFTDFWRMTWENNVHLVVMLTNLVEKNRPKADIYWPRHTNSVLRYGNVNVKFVKERSRGQSIKLRYFDIWYDDSEVETISVEKSYDSDDEDEKKKSFHIQFRRTNESK